MRGLLEADDAIGNAEGPITVRTEKAKAKQRWSYNADPRAAAALRDAGFTALGLANNHATDRGPEGLRDTIRHLSEVGIASFGAGMNEAEALRPLLVDTPHGRLGVVGFTTRPSYADTAEGDAAGTAVVTRERVRRAVEHAREEGARWLAAYVHWGRNYRPVRRRQREAAELFADAGFDLVVGHGAHSHQPAERIGDTWVLYSVGNFVFMTPGRFDRYDIPGYGLVVRSFLGDGGFEALELRCILTDNEVVAFQPRPCPPDEARAMLAGVASEVALRGEVGVLTWRRGPDRPD